MTLLFKLFSARRWMLWLPVPISALLADTPTDFIKMLVGGLIVWVPFWLTWWLTDGFLGFQLGTSGTGPSVTGGVNPATGQPCQVHHLPWGDVRSGGD